MACMTGAETWFFLAISSMVVAWRSASLAMRSPMAGSCFLRRSRVEVEGGGGDGVVGQWGRIVESGRRPLLRLKPDDGVRYILKECASRPQADHPKGEQT